MSIVSKRLISYLIDMFIIIILTMLFNLIIPVNDNDLKELNEKKLQNEITNIEYINEYKTITHNMDKENVLTYAFTTIMTIINFIIIPFIFKSTIGQKIMKLEIKKEDIKIEDYVGRAVIISGLGYMLLLIIILFLVNDDIYFILINLLGFFQIIVVIINGFMVLYKEKHCGIADNFTNTRIEEIKCVN